MLEVWKKIGSEVVLAGKFGKKLIMQIFLNPKTGKEEEYVMFAQKDWSVVLPVTTDGKVITVKEFKQGRNCVDIELPAGTACVEGEQPEPVISRELLEETGYQAGKMIYLGFSWVCTRNSPTKFHCFLALDCEKVAEQKLDENEIIEFGLLPLDEWISWVKNGDITEPSAVVATMRALKHLGLCIYHDLQ